MWFFLLIFSVKVIIFLLKNDYISICVCMWMHIYIYIQEFKIWKKLKFHTLKIIFFISSHIGMYTFLFFIKIFNKVRISLLKNDYIHIRVCIFICMYTYTYTHIHTYIRIHTHTHIHNCPTLSYPFFFPNLSLFIFLRLWVRIITSVQFSKYF